MQNTLSSSSALRHTRSLPSNDGLGRGFWVCKKQLAGGGKQIHSEHRRTSAGSPVPAMLSQSGMCERSELAANDSDGGRCRGSRMGGVSDGLHSTFSQRLVFISIPPSASVLFSSTSNPRPASCFQCPQKNKKRCWQNRKSSVIYHLSPRELNELNKQFKQF